jgi:hypothetical protein
MSVVISQEPNNCMVVTVTGVFSYQDLQAVQNTAKAILNSSVKTNCLILAQQFTGWGKEGNWGDLTFMYENDSLIGKIAVVAEKKRQVELLMFLGGGMRQAAVKYFFPGEEQEARAWLSEPAK